MYSHGELFLRLQECYFGVYFLSLRNNEGNNHQDNTRVSVETVRHENKYIILILTRHMDA